MNANERRERILGRLSLLFLWTKGTVQEATTHQCSGGGLNSSSGGELKLYLKWKRNTSNSKNTSSRRELFSQKKTYKGAAAKQF